MFVSHTHYDSLTSLLQSTSMSVDIVVGHSPAKALKFFASDPHESKIDDNWDEQPPAPLLSRVSDPMICRSLRTHSNNNDDDARPTKRSRKENLVTSDTFDERDGTASAFYFVAPQREYGKTPLAPHMRPQQPAAVTLQGLSLV
eukprot:c10168_g1_i1.p2 GENE.c10168_g1_i1~~c10168_g1_i1.p2  ORF type:complete len:144 (-),score=44.60 c10168_g1_i1:153-584(-)